MPPAMLLRSLLRQPWGPLLLALQLALTAAITANALSVTAQELRQLQRATGLDEALLLVVESQRLDTRPASHEETAADLAALRALPGVEAATRLNSLPLADHGWRTPVQSPGSATVPTERLHAGLFIVDEQGLDTLGLRLVEGRAPRASDLPAIDFEEQLPAGAWISRPLASLLFPNGSATGQRFSMRSRGEVQVLGVLERLTSAWPEWPLHEQTVLMVASIRRSPSLYVVRAADNEQELLRAQIVSALMTVDAQRLLSPVRRYADIRDAALRPQRSLAMVLTGLVAALLLVSGLGVFGTARYWVQRRRRQIGTRRALGARRADIVRLFLSENLLITAAGLAAALPLAWALNRVLVQRYDIATLEPSALLLAGALQLLVGQLAVLGPALRAAAVDPALAARNL